MRESSTFPWALSCVVVITVTYIVHELPLLFTHLSPKDAIGSQGFWEMSDPASKGLRTKGLMGGYHLLHVDYTRGTRFGSILS